MIRGAAEVDVILFDLDNTLYAPDCGLLAAGDRAITRFIAQRLGMSWEEADRLRLRTWQQYGATARGLEVEFGVPQREFFAGSVELVPVERYVQPRPEVAAMLARLPQRLFVFTNASATYAERVLAALGLRHLIERVFDIDFGAGRPKPEGAGYRRVLREVGAPAARVALIEDTEANLAPAAELGMVTIKLGPPPPAPPHLFLPDLMHLPRLLGL
ncbi:MAG: pyrimidine 5'-nucleotidase [Armatimonadota bacterium]